jgi:hypothetical protein
MIQDEVTIRARFGKGLAQLLDDPLRSRVSGHVEMQNLPTPMLDDKKQYNTWNVSVGTVKKSNAAITSR